VTTVGIPDLLADGARSADELAAVTDCDARALYRVLRALAAAGVLHEDEDRRFTLTELGDLLRADAPGSLAPWAALNARPYLWQAWGELMHSVRTGENAFAHVHGADVWEYRAEHPEEGAIFDRAMTGNTRRSNQAVVDAYDFGRFDTVVDVGGGQGVMLAAILQANPNVRGVLFDQPHVVAAADEVLRGIGVADRVRIESGDFFAAVPSGGDAYVLRFVIHDWPDAECMRILRNIRAVLPSGGRVLVLENLVPPPNEGLDVKLLDLQMLVAPGGQERTLEEYERLFADSGLELVATTPTAAGLSVIEAAGANRVG
jgi:ubiquinone/menaquinone biosynthesis C-methylase UbiE